MEHMDLHQPTIQNEEQKKSKLHARDGEDDTSYPSAKCGKHDLDLPAEKPAVEDYRLDKLFDFRDYTSEPAQLYEDLIRRCKEEIKVCKKAFDDASEFFKFKFENDLEKKQPSPQSTFVIESIRSAQEKVKTNLELAIKHLPSFSDAVKIYLKYRDDQLLHLQVADKQFYQKINDLAEIPNVENLVKGLLYNVKDDKEIERRSGLNIQELHVIISFLRKLKNIFVPFCEEENPIDKEQYGESEMEALLIKHKDEIKELSSIRSNYETAKDNVNGYVEKYEEEICDRLWSMEGYLKLTDSWVRTMRRQLEVLQQKDVILNGCVTNFDIDWVYASQQR